MKSHPNEKTNSEWTPDERTAAIRALNMNWPNLIPSSSEYAHKLNALAEFARRFGRDEFELYYNLREPRNRLEQLSVDLYRGKVTIEDYGNELRKDAERPIDLPMLTAFHDGLCQKLGWYSQVLKDSILLPSEMHTDLWQRREKDIENSISEMNGKLPLWSDHFETVLEFLEEQRIVSGKGLMTLGEFEGTSAHWLALLVFRRTTEYWQSAKHISERSASDPRYTYVARAIDLFSQEYRKHLPLPQNLQERLREEFVQARLALRAAIASPESPLHNPC
jgi:hypothetical protein